MQLPYLDTVIFTVAAANLIPAKAGLGEAGPAAALSLRPERLHFPAKSAKKSGVKVLLWRRVRARSSPCPNLERQGRDLE